MHKKQRRQYEMLLRVRDFGKTHGHAFSSSGMGPEVFVSISAAVDELAATALAKVSAAGAARADHKRRARRDLAQLLGKVSQLAHVLRARGQTVPVFALPASRSDLEVLTVARQFARDAAALEVDFRGHGMGSSAIAAAADAFERAMRDRTKECADHVAALARTKDILAGALLDVRRLDLIVDNELRNDAVTTAVWKQARRVCAVKGARAGGLTGDLSSRALEEAGEMEDRLPAFPVPQQLLEQDVLGQMQHVHLDAGLLVNHIRAGTRFDLITIHLHDDVGVEGSSRIASSRPRGIWRVHPSTIMNPRCCRRTSNLECSILAAGST